MRIIYYSPHPHLNLQSPSGYGTHMREMINAFESKGCKVLPVILGGTTIGDNQTELNNQSGSKQVAKKILGPKIWRVLKDLDLIRFDRLAQKKLIREINNFNPDLIYERGNYLQLSGVYAAKATGIRHAMELNSPYLEETDFLSQGKSLLYKWGQRREKDQLDMTDQVVTVSEALKDYFIEKHGLRVDKFTITPNAFNRDSIQLDENRQKKIQKELGLTGETVIGFVGSIFKWHGLDKLIEAFDQLHRNDTRLLIVGFGEYMEELKKMCSNLERGKDVIFTGKVPRSEVFDYIQLMDICTAPGAAWYQSPVKVFEYGALGKPIIAPDTGPVREIMEHKRDAWLVQPSTESLYEALSGVLNDQNLRKKMGISFQEKVFTRYTWQKNADRVLNYFNALSSL